ncbi:unnamed protein product [Arabis nemorensis]|uniref:Uncharacterized protein n=1 Tax=Arabis nemorensis TaxID=586526 RepID=A0A565BEL5_9BRAS|nr:unnamed protein product [Arabis nemorensis]
MTNGGIIVLRKYQMLQSSELMPLTNLDRLDRLFGTKRISTDDGYYIQVLE